MATAFVNSWFSGGAASGTTAAIGPQSLTSGNLLVLLVACKGTGLTVTSITDTAGNTYTSCGAASVDTNNYRTELFYVVNALGNASNTTTVHMSGTVTDLNVASLQYSGLATGTPFDVATAGHGASGTAWAATSFSPAATGELCVSFAIGSGGIALTAGTGFLLRDSGAGSGGFLGGEDILSAGSGAQTGAFTSNTSQSWQVVAAFFSTVNLGAVAAPPSAAERHYPPRRLFGKNPASRFRHPDAAFPQPAPAVYAQPTLVQHLNSSALKASVALNGNNFKFTLPNSVGAGNCLILVVSFQWSSTKAVSSITDSTGDTWSATPTTTTTDGALLISALFVLPNASAGLHTITVNLNATSQVFSYIASEFTNITTSSPISGFSANSTSVAPELKVGPFTPSSNDTNGGNLVLSYFIDATDGRTANWTTNFKPDPNSTLLHGDIAWHTQGIPHAAQFQVQPTFGPVMPQMYATMTPGNDTYNCLAVALKVATAGTFNPDAIRITRLLHGTNETPPGGANWDLQLPSTGDLLIWATANFDNILTVSGITDSNGNTWTKEDNSNTGLPQLWYAQKAKTSLDLVLHVAVAASPTPQGASFVMYDIVGSDTTIPDPKDAVASAAQGANGISLLTDFPVITPPSFGITIVVMGLGQGPGLGLHAGSPTGAVFDLVNYTNETDLDTLDNADGKAHILNTDTTTQHWNWDITNIGSNSAFALAVHFKALAAAPGSASFWFSRPPTRRFYPNPLMRFRSERGTFLQAATALAGGIFGAATITADLSLAQALAGGIAGQATLASDLSLAVALAGAIAGQATLSANLVEAIALSGNIAGVANLAASLALAKALAGNIAGQATLTADAGLGVALSGHIAGAALVTADLAEAIALAGSISGTATITGRLTRPGGAVTYAVFIFDD